MDHVRTLRASARFPNAHDGKITGMAYDDAGETLATCADDECVVLYDALNGTMLDKLRSPRWGAAAVTFTHSRHAVLYASGPAGGKPQREHVALYHDVHSNAIVRVFRGHCARIQSVALSATSDVFATATRGKDTVRLWDLASPTAVARIPQPSSGAGASAGQRGSKEDNAVVAFHPDGLRLAVGSAGTIVQYDLRFLPRGPLSVLRLTDSAMPPTRFTIPFVQMRYSGIGDAGASMFVSFTTGVLSSIDATSGATRWRVNYPEQLPDVRFDGQFDASPDGEFVCTGSDNGRVHFWDAADGSRRASLYYDTAPVGFVRWNPVYRMFAVAADGGTVSQFASAPAAVPVRPETPRRSSLRRPSVAMDADWPGAVAPASAGNSRASSPAYNPGQWDDDEEASGPAASSAGSSSIVDQLMGQLTQQQQQGL